MLRKSRHSRWVVLAGLLGFLGASAHAAPCANPQTAIGLERIVEVEPGSGPLFGALTHQVHEPAFLAEREVVLTFDDGPSPWVTPKILDTLERHCTKATFFAVGNMAVAYPHIARDIIARGHTLGSHTLSHPRRLPEMPAARAHDEIERGFAALEAATGGGIAPFFRFTGLNDSAPLLSYLQRRGVASFTVDVVSDDSFIAAPDELARVTIERTVRKNGGILLFHDIKPGTAKALPMILEGLRERGFRIVHLRHRSSYTADPSLVADYTERAAKKLAKSQGRPRLMPFYGAISEIREAAGRPPVKGSGPSVPVTLVDPKPRDRGARASMKVASPPKPPVPAPEQAKPAVPPQPIPATRPDDEEVLPWKRAPSDNLSTSALPSKPAAVGEMAYSPRRPGP